MFHFPQNIVSEYIIGVYSEDLDKLSVTGAYVARLNWVTDIQDGMIYSVGRYDARFLHLF